MLRPLFTCLLMRRGGWVWPAKFGLNLPVGFDALMLMAEVSTFASTSIGIPVPRLPHRVRARY